MAAPVAVTRPSLSDVTPHEFAQAVCERAVLQAERLLRELGEGATLRTVPAKFRATKLWKRAFTWCEYAQTGHAEHPDLLDDFEAYDEVSELVRECVIARRKINRGETLGTVELAAIANMSRIHVANFVRSNQLKAIRGEDKSFSFTAADAREFLRAREVAGF